MGRDDHGSRLRHCETHLGDLPPSRLRARTAAMAITQSIGEPGELPTGVDLWVLSPRFIEAPFANGKNYAALVDGLAERSNPESTLVLWIHLRNFADEKFWNPSFDRWTRHGVIVSGSGDRTEVGFVFSNAPLRSARDIVNFRKKRWKHTVIWSEAGGPQCSKTCRWILKKISVDGATRTVCDPYAKHPALALWCRRMNMEYRGYSRYQGVRRRIEKELAQVDLPGIQEELPLLIDNGE